MKLVAVLTVSVLFLGACSKNSSREKDNILPVITITTPVNGQIFTAGQPIPISGSIADDQYIAEAHIHVSDINIGALLMDVHLYPGSNSTSFNQSINATAGINYKIQVIAKDRAANEARASVEVSAN